MEESQPTSSSWIATLVDDFRKASAKIQLTVVILAVISAILILRSFEGHDLFVLEPGLDEGFVYAKTYSWWGLHSEIFELQRIPDDYAYPTWHVRKYKSGSIWRPLFGPAPDGDVAMYFR